MKAINGGVCAAKGFKANGIHCGIRAGKVKKDLALIVSDVPAAAAAVGSVRDIAKCVELDVDMFNLTDSLQMLCQHAAADTAEIIALAAGEDRRKDLVRLGRRKDEDHV